MKKSNSFLVVIAGVLITLFSCNDPEIEKQNLSDAFIISKIVDDDTVYSLGAFVSSNTAMKSVTMRNPDGSLSIDLKKSDYYSLNFERQIKDEDFTKIKPTVGKYKFEITYGDATTTDTADYVSSDVIEPVAINRVEYDSEYKSIKISWVKNQKADYYIINFFRHDTIVFQSNSINPAYSSIHIFENTPSWYKSVNSNPSDTLQVIVSAFLVENKNSMNAGLQALSLSSKVDFVFPN